jgi:hypothetical protein
MPGLKKSVKEFSEIFSGLKGKWSIERTITHHQFPNYIYDTRGVAEFNSLFHATSFNYNEKVITSLRGQDSHFSGYNKYIYEYNFKDNQLLIYFGENETADVSKKLKLFLILPIQRQENYCYNLHASHQCGQDLYKANLFFSVCGKLIEINYNVVGANKSYLSTTQMKFLSSQKTKIETPKGVC